MALALKAPSKGHDTFEPDRVLDGIHKAIEEVGLVAAGDFDVRWQPCGLSCGVHGKRFRILIHTWPEHALSTLDVWVQNVRIDAVISALETALGWRRTEQDEILRLEGAR
jgi:S-adenosylmethionine/arginine decarboxylase-like enzyme